MSVLFGDIEDAVIDWLNPRLDPTVRTKVPKGTSPPYVVIQRLGGNRVSVVHETATIAIEAFGKSDKEAHDLAQFARQAVHDLPGEVVNGLVFYRVEEFAAPVRLPDPISAKPRFTFTVSIWVRGFTSA